MGYWPKHPRKELEALLREFDRASWRIEGRRKYYKVWCPCGAHDRMVHMTPSSSNYAKNVRRWLSRQTCYPWEADR